MSTHPHLPASGHVSVYATSWCPYCSRLRAQLNDAAIPFDEVDVDADTEAAAFVEGVNGGNRVVPTVVYPDGSTATNPTGSEVAARLA